MHYSLLCCKAACSCSIDLLLLAMMISSSSRTKASFPSKVVAKNDDAASARPQIEAVVGGNAPALSSPKLRKRRRSCFHLEIARARALKKRMMMMMILTVIYSSSLFHHHLLAECS